MSDVSGYLDARQKVAQALSVEQDARDEWSQTAADTPAAVAAWDRYTQAGIDVVTAEDGLEPFADLMAAGVARSRFYADPAKFVESKEDFENLEVAAFRGPKEVPKRAMWVAFCDRAGIDPDFDPGAEALAHV